jgi:hypothetical protein
MSKTYNDKYDFEKIAKDKEIYYWDAHLLATRHPNKKRRTSLNREFHKVKLSSPANWKNRYGDAYDKSSRMHLSAREVAMKRRRRLDHDAQDEINRELYE